MSRVVSDGLSIITLGPFADPNAPTSLDARCARLSLRWGDDPLCCARGADIDGRARLQIIKHLPLVWSDEGPRQFDPAPSGIVERLADVAWKRSELPTDRLCCSALDLTIPKGGVAGDGCLIRAAKEGWLLDECALFPLALVDSTLIPSPRIPDAALVAFIPLAEGGRSLWDLARARVALRFGDEVARSVDEGVASLHAHRAHGLHLKTLK